TPPRSLHLRTRCNRSGRARFPLKTAFELAYAVRSGLSDRRIALRFSVQLERERGLIEPCDFTRPAAIEVKSHLGPGNAQEETGSCHRGGQEQALGLCGLSQAQAIRSEER